MPRVYRPLHVWWRRAGHGPAPLLALAVAGAFAFQTPQSGNPAPVDRVADPFAIGWLLVNMRRVRLEEVHLQKLFGAAYDRYTARTPRFIPGGYLFHSGQPAGEGQD